MFIHFKRCLLLVMHVTQCTERGGPFKLKKKIHRSLKYKYNPMGLYLGIGLGHIIERVLCLSFVGVIDLFIYLFCGEGC